MQFNIQDKEVTTIADVLEIETGTPTSEGLVPVAYKLKKKETGYIIESGLKHLPVEHMALLKPPIDFVEFNKVLSAFEVVATSKV